MNKYDQAFKTKYFELSSFFITLIISFLNEKKNYLSASKIAMC